MSKSKVRVHQTWGIGALSFHLGYYIFGKESTWKLFRKIGIVAYCFDIMLVEHTFFKFTPIYLGLNELGQSSNRIS